MGFFSEVCLVLDQFPYLPPIMYAFICAGSFHLPGKTNNLCRHLFSKHDSLFHCREEGGGSSSLQVVTRLMPPELVALEGYERS